MNTSNLDQPPPRNERRTESWQKKNRPLMVWMLIVLTAVFFVGSSAQLLYLNYKMANPPKLEQKDLLGGRSCAPPSPRSDMSAFQCMQLQRDRAILLLESNLIERRYHQANTVVMFSVWSRYLGFVTGMVLAMVGAAFILGKLTEAETRVEAGYATLKASIGSTSPGLVMCFLGSILIVVSITTLSQLETHDQAVYLNGVKSLVDDGRPIGEQTSK